MALINDATVLNAMATQTNIDEWSSPAFDALSLNDTNQPSRGYRSSSACAQMIIKSGQDSWWYDDVSFSIDGGIRGDKLLIMWIKMFAPATTTILTDIFTGMYDTVGSRGGNGGRWQQDLMMEVADHYGWWPATMYPTQPDETLGTFSSMAKGSMDSIELAIDNSGSIDVKLAFMGAAHTISYIGAHGQAITYEGLLTYAKDKTTPRDWGVVFKTGPNSYRFRVSIRVGDASATVATTFAESGKTIYFDNVNTDHEIGYDFINPTGGATLSFTIDGGTREWNDGNSKLWTGENNVDTWTPTNITWINGGGGASLPTHVSGKTTNIHIFNNCGTIDIGDGVMEDCTFLGVNTDPAVIYIGATDTRRIKNNTYTGRTVAVEHDTVGNFDYDGEIFISNTNDIENSGNVSVVNATTIVTGNAYKIVSTGGGSTDYTTVGSADNVVGTKFVATGTPTGTGTVTRVLLISKLNGANPSTVTNTGTNADTLIVGSVSVSVTVSDEDLLTSIENAQTSIYLLDSPFTEIMNQDTNVSGVASTTYGGTVPVQVKWRCRKSDDLDDPRYVAKSGITTITAEGLNLGVLLKQTSLPLS